jgi:hypothetical protein
MDCFVDVIISVRTIEHFKQMRKCQTMSSCALALRTCPNTRGHDDFKYSSTKLLTIDLANDPAFNKQCGKLTIDRFQSLGLSERELVECV